MPSDETIDQEYVKTTCLLGQGARCCAFLMMAPGFSCAKGTSIEPHIRERLEAGTMTAQGDNCPGWRADGQ